MKHLYFFFTFISFVILGTGTLFCQNQLLIRTDKTIYNVGETITFHLRLTDQNDQPVAEQSGGVNDPCLFICKLLPNTDIDGRITYSACAPTDTGLIIYDFIIGGVHGSYGIFVTSPHYPLSDSIFVFQHTQPNPALSPGQTNRNLDILVTSMLNAVNETIQDPFAMYAALPCAGGIVAIPLTGGLSAGVSAATCPIFLGSLANNTVREGGKGLVEMLDIPDKEQWKTNIDQAVNVYDVLSFSYGIYSTQYFGNDMLSSSKFPSNLGNNFDEAVGNVLGYIADWKSAIDGTSAPTHVKYDTTSAFDSDPQFSVSCVLPLSGKLRSKLLGDSIIISFGIRKIDPSFQWQYQGTVRYNANIRVLLFTDSHTLFAGTALGIFISSDKGKTWPDSALRYNNIVSLILTSGGIMFAASNSDNSNSGIYWSFDGKNWTHCYTGTNANDREVRALATNKSGYIYAGLYGVPSKGIIRSTDNGASWENISSGLTTYNIRSLIVTKNNTVLAGSNSGLIFRSTNNGDQWNQVYQGTVNVPILSFTLDSSGNVLAGTGDNGALILKSTDEGTSWTSFNSGLPNGTVYSLLCRKNEVVYASLYGYGVYNLNPNNSRWETCTDSLPDLQVTAMTINNNDTLFAGTSTGKIFICNGICLVDVQENKSFVPSSYHLKQNYPNPFNPSTNIEYSLPHKSHVKITVLNILGQEIATLIDAIQDAGFKSVELNAKHIPSGMYFYRLQADNFIETKKLLLLK
ncbi:MAG: T9SS type A sorting domain-containing protein [Ignavibacteriae bacterium]|nr:T9SS type A sorting domain-containing protein [Ignavibacteriota bacterium]